VPLIVRDRRHSIWWRDQEYFVEISSINNQPISDYSVDIILKGAQVKISKLVKTLEPIERFILDAGQEMYSREPYLGGRRRDTTYTRFEPTVSLTPGSVRITLYPTGNDTENVKSDEPLRLLVQILEVAATGRLINYDTIPHLERVKSVDRLLEIVKDIAGQAKDAEEIMIRAPNLDKEVVVDAKVLHTLDTSIRQDLWVRVEEKSGTLTAAVFDKKWCRIETGSGTWRLSFSKELFDSVKGSVPRLVKVIFRTDTPEGALRGSGELLEIQDIRRATTHPRR